MSKFCNLFTIVTLGVIILWAMVSCNQWVGKKYDRQRARIIAEHCKVTSFYGQSGAGKVYTCDSGVYREVDL